METGKQEFESAAQEVNTTDWLLEKYQLVQQSTQNLLDEDEDVILELETGVQVSITQQRRSNASAEGTIGCKRRNEEEIDMDLSALFSGRLLCATRRIHAKVKKIRPNHFFAIQISSSDIHAAIQAVQDSIILKQPLLKKAMIALTSSHITLAVTHLANNEDIERAKQALIDTGTKLKEHMEARPLEIPVEHIGHFQNKVVFANIHNQDCLQRLQDVVRVLREQCESSGLAMEEGRDFVPHLTMFKLSKDPTLYKKGLKSISPHLYKEHGKIVFGKEVVRSIQLLSMDDPKDERGYYASRGEYHFNIANCQQTPSATEVAAEARRQNRLQIRQLIQEKLTHNNQASTLNDQSSGKDGVS